MPGCKHEPIEPLSNNNGNGGNGGNGGNNGGNGLPCSPDSVYFEQQILPFLISNCTRINGCHSANVAEDGVILNSYLNVMLTADVEPFNLNGSDLWEVINETDPDDRMPPLGEPQLSQQQKDLIALWISQGAQNLHCDEGLSACDSVAVSYSAEVQPILQGKCIGCHTTGNASNGFVVLNNYQGVSAVASSGQLVGSITHANGYNAMPQGGPKINACDIAKIRNWVNDGFQNN